MMAARSVQLHFSALVVLLVVSGAGAAVTTSTFDSGSDGWTWANTGHSWQSSGGNPDGYIRYNDNRDNGASSAITAPSEYLGDWAAMGVTNLVYETIVFTTGSVYKVGTYSVVLAGPGGQARWYGPSPDPSAGWLSLDVPIKESDWTVQSGSWEALLADVDQLNINMEYYNNWGPFEITGVDNVRLYTGAGLPTIPAPGAIALGWIGTVFVAWFQRRRSR